MAELNLTERQAGDITILDMDGKVTIGHTSLLCLWPVVR